MDQEIKKYFDRLNAKISLLLEDKKKETWVTVSWVTELTGFDKEKLRMARDQGIIKCKRSNTGGYLYLLESIPSQFIINQHEKDPGTGSRGHAHLNAV